MTYNGRQNGNKPVTHRPRKQPPCDDIRPNVLINVGRPDVPDEYSGFIIIRLSADLQIGRGENLTEVAKQLDLHGLLAILEEFDLYASRRVVRSLSPDEIIRLERKAAQTELPPIHSLTSYWRVDVRHQPDRIDDILKRLNRLFEVDRAYQELAVSDPAIVNTMDDIYAIDQDYLDAAPVGIDARWAWTQPDGCGSGVALVDLEQGWFPNHEDLVAKSPSLIYGDNRDGVGTYKGNHGTAVLGELVAEDNTMGVVGIAPAVTSVRMVSHYDAATNTALHVADAILAAIPVMSPGDLLLLEVQRSYKPTEIDDADFDAIRLAVAHGIIVVEAAGNGNTDLDNYTNGAGDKIFDRTDPTFRESGAIMIGAAQSALPHDRASFSNYGSRIDCYGWGTDVVTCGYGDLDAGAGDNETYTDTFSGTSSASPIVTGAALILQGMYEAASGTRLSPGQMRALLSNPATGTPQGPTIAGDIGVMPDLRAIIEDTLGLVPDIYLRDNVGDTGQVPSTGMISSSPDVIVRPAVVANPTASFGEGSGAENSTTLGYQVEAGQDNFIYVRMKNRGLSDANNATATVYWSEVSTLVTPDMWHLIGTTAPITVPQGDTLTVAGPLTWPEPDIPATGHYCFVAVLDQSQDEAPPLPPGPPDFDFDDFRAFIRSHNNVTWRNFNVIDDIPDPAGDPAAFPFIIAGAPDRSRLFDLEIIQHLPRGARLWVELPLALAMGLHKKNLWKMDVDRKRNVARLHLPLQPCLQMCNVYLAKGVKYRARFLVQGAKEMKRGGHNFAIRQIFDTEEVGRVTWQFHRRRKNRDNEA